MKSLLSISLTLLLLLTGVNVKIASHYCGGRISDVKISLTGEAASCGMEHKPATIPSEGLISPHCCDDVVSSVYLSADYVPAHCYNVPLPGYEIYNSFITPDPLLIHQDVLCSSLSRRGRQQGGLSPSNVQQQVICIFQI